MGLDEALARGDTRAHQHVEGPVGLDGILDGHLQDRPRLRIHGRLPELLRVHLAQALVALQGRLPPLELGQKPLLLGLGVGVVVPPVGLDAV